jgi:hypothetical protein
VRESVPPAEEYVATSDGCSGGAGDVYVSASEAEDEGTAESCAGSPASSDDTSDDGESSEDESDDGDTLFDDDESEDDTEETLFDSDDGYDSDDSYDSYDSYDSSSDDSCAPPSEARPMSTHKSTPNKARSARRSSPVSRMALFFGAIVLPFRRRRRVEHGRDDEPARNRVP